MKLVISGQGVEIYRSLAEYGFYSMSDTAPGMESIFPLMCDKITRTEALAEDSQIRMYFAKHNQVPKEFRQFVVRKQ